MKRYFFGSLALIWVAAALPAKAETGNGAKIFQAMEEEMARSLKELRVDDFGPPYFINYQVRHHDRAEVVATFGSLLESDIKQKQTLFVDVKVGDPEFDSSHPQSHQYVTEALIPLDNQVDALRRALWYETDLRYKQAIVNLLKKKGRFISGVESHEIADFSPGNPPQVRLGPVPEWKPRMQEWEALARTVSERFRNAKDIEKSKVKVSANRTIRYYYDSEGNKIREGKLYYALVIEGWARSPEGDRLHDEESVYLHEGDAFPTEEELISRADRLIEALGKLKRAPRMDPYIGPAIFSPDATAVLFHEALGHRLEGDRLRQDRDGKTFLKKIGRRILPGFLSVTDNPELTRFQGTPLLGHYRFDDEGQESEEVVLVEGGTLQNFLLTRMPVLGFSRTNGHARGDGVHAPMSRMSNFIIESKSQVDAPTLKRKLIEEVQRQGKPFGLFVKKITGGETHTEGAGFQVFKGEPLYLYKVYPDGREELVRGVDFVGTPLSMIGKIMVTGQKREVLNGFCHAESGAIPVTSIAPSVLLREVELQGAKKMRVRPPILTPPAVSTSIQ
ncbi:TldD/PmbA family [Nitrospina gracilis 3/211]|uniref:TldD/PmbA family n=1 Tax=Nitrospina gracilis (strain 3/211) TaxID=1266370 RepID=M1YUY9_NITG3|nr:MULTISPECIES: metallopeptidase TldD-related protein [Nitrospina]MCF8722215.1 putative Zn-dependent protease [Nitrospina sp. Nb-3]CCQ89410.1 TldD/PmbA family [Nitrospina gracilis 3/211]